MLEILQGIKLNLELMLLTSLLYYLVSLLHINVLNNEQNCFLSPLKERQQIHLFHFNRSSNCDFY